MLKRLGLILTSLCISGAGLTLYVQVPLWKAAEAKEAARAEALEAALIGIEAAKVVLRAADDWSPYLAPRNGKPGTLPGWETPKNQALGRDLPGGTTVALSILNNEDDRGFAAGKDLDGIVIVRAEARHPGREVRILETRLAHTPPEVPR